MKKKKITEEIAIVTQKYEHFQKLYETLDSEFVCGIKLGEEKNNMTFLVKGNPLKRRSKEAFEKNHFAKRKMPKDAKILFLLHRLFVKKVNN